MQFTIRTHSEPVQTSSSVDFGLSWASRPALYVCAPVCCCHLRLGWLGTGPWHGWGEPLWGWGDRTHAHVLSLFHIHISTVFFFAHKNSHWTNHCIHLRTHARMCNIWALHKIKNTSHKNPPSPYLHTVHPWFTVQSACEYMCVTLRTLSHPQFPWLASTSPKRCCCLAAGLNTAQCVSAPFQPQTVPANVLLIRWLNYSCKNNVDISLKIAVCQILLANLGLQPLLSNSSSDLNLPPPFDSTHTFTHPWYFFLFPSHFLSCQKVQHTHFKRANDQQIKRSNLQNYLNRARKVE